MMQRKKLKLLLASLAASTILFAVPMSVAATGTANSPDTTADPDNPDSGDDDKDSDINSGPNYNLSTVSDAVSITDACGKSCPGHHITQSDPAKSHTIAVVGGTHKIYFDASLSIKGATNAPPFEIFSGATVDLYLVNSTNSTLDNSNTGTGAADLSQGGAGLQVRTGGTLTLHGPGELTAKGSDGAAGIGGFSEGSGDITILGGTIHATGGKAAAGIGSGHTGGCGNITIKNDAKVYAKGGDFIEFKVGNEVVDTQEGGPGIGHAQSHTSKGGNVNISGGTVYAIGGQKNKDNPSELTDGLLCSSLTSTDGSGDIFTNNTSLEGVEDKSAGKINAIIWQATNMSATKNDTIGVVWGNGTIGENIMNTKLLLRPNSTLTITKKPTSLTQCAIQTFGDANTANNNSIYNRDYISTVLPPLPYGIKEYVSLSRDTLDVTKEKLYYTGDDLTDKALIPKPSVPRPGGTPGVDDYLVDTTDWYPFISRYGSPASLDTKILRRGSYEVIYKHKNPLYTETNGEKEYDKEFNVPESIEVLPAKLSECKFKIEPLTYTGEKLEPQISATFNNNLVESSEYSVKWEELINAGTYTAELSPSNDSDFEGTTAIEYEIESVSIEDAKISIDPDTPEYTGKKQEPNVTVTFKGEPLKLDTDYTLTFSGGDSVNFTNAGPITCTITGTGNYEGNISDNYIISPKHITIKSGNITAVDKDYNGNGEVTLEGIEFDGLVSSDKGKVKLKSKGIVDEKNEGHAGTYKSVHLDKENIELVYEDGTPCENYIVDYNGEELVLSKDVTINKVTPEKRQPNHVDPYVVNANGTTFDCTIQIQKQPGVDYQFKMDGEPSAEEGWVDGTNSEDKTKSSAVFTAINAAKDATDKHIFYVRSKGTNDVVQEMMLPYELVFEKLKNPKADVPAFELSINEGNADKKTYTVTIPKVDDPDVEYRIITVGSEEDVPYSPTVVDKTDCKPGTKYIGQIRYKETPVYKASEPVSSPELTTPKSPLADSGPKYKTTWKRIIPNQSDSVEVPETLQAEGYTSMQEITTDLTRHLAGLGAYQDQEHTAFYDVKVQVITRNDAGEPETRDAEPGDFENGGIPVTLPAKSLPQGVVATENQFSAAHMFESEDFAEYSAGEIETCMSSEGSEVFQGTGKGVTFVVNGTSPVGIAWSTAPENPDDPNNPDGNDPNNPEDPNNPDNNDPNNPDNNDPNNPNGTDPNNPDGNNGDANAADPNANNAADPNAANANGTDANGEDAKSAAQSAVDALKSAAASLLPKTGDTSKIIMWVVAAVAACIAVIAVLRSKAKKGKKAKSSSSAKTSATAKKPAATTAKKPSSTTAKKTTAKKPASGTAKKTTTTKKGR